jgi:hypothetical protein
MTNAMGSQAQLPQLSVTADQLAGLRPDAVAFSPPATTLPVDAVGQRAAERSRLGAFALAVVALVALVAVFAVVGLVQRSSKTHVLTESQLVVGDCLVGSNMGLGTQSAWPDTVTAVSCTREHIGEVFYVGYPWPASLATYPGNSAINATVNATCSSAFATYVGINPALSMYHYDEVAPEGDWASGDREVVCVAYVRGLLPLHRSIKGTGQ